jgi:hypothetical protein
MAIQHSVSGGWGGGGGGGRRTPPHGLFVDGGLLSRALSTHTTMARAVRSRLARSMVIAPDG